MFTIRILSTTPLWFMKIWVKSDKIFYRIFPFQDSIMSFWMTCPVLKAVKKPKKEDILFCDHETFFLKILSLYVWKKIVGLYSYYCTRIKKWTLFQPRMFHFKLILVRGRGLSAGASNWVKLGFLQFVTKSVFKVV